MSPTVGGGLGDLGMWKRLRYSAGFSNLGCLTQLLQESFPCGDERSSVQCLRKAPYPVLRPKPLRSDTRKTKQELRLGPKGLSAQPSISVDICGHAFVQVAAQLVSECPCVSREAPSSGMSSGALRFLIFWRCVAKGMDTVSQDTAGRVLWYGSREKSLEAVFARAAGTDV